jgi:hypothetical protein
MDEAVKLWDIEMLSDPKIYKRGFIVMEAG